MTEERKHSIVRAAGIVVLFTAMAKIIAFLKIALLSAVLASGPVADEFQAAFRLPDFFYNLLILGTLSLAFIPVFVEYHKKDQKEAEEIANTILSLAFICMSVLMIILFFAAPWVLHLIVPGFTAEKYQNTLELTRILLVSPIIFTVSSVFYGILNSLKRFVITSLAPVVYNLSLMFGVGYLYPRIGIKGLAFGAVLGAILHLSLQVFAAHKAGFGIRPRLNLNHPGVKKIAKLFLPRIFGLDVGQFSLLIATIIGSTLASGSIAFFNYAYDLEFVAIGVFAVAFAIVSFPALSEAFTQNDDKEFNHILVRTMINILFFIIPIAVLLIILRAQIVRVVLLHGNFNFHDTKVVSNAVAIFAISLASQGLSPLLSRAFFARHNTITPMLIGFGTMAINVVASLLLSRHFGVFGLAAGFSIASLLDAMVLFLFLRASLKHLDDTYLVNSIAKILIASLLMGIFGHFALSYLGSSIELNSTLHVFVQGFVAGIAGIIIFIVSASLLGIEQMQFIIAKVKGWLTFKIF